MSVAERKKQAMNQKIGEARFKKELEKMINDAYEAGQKDATIDTVYLFLWVMKERFGYGSTRLRRIYEEAIYFSECILDEKTGFTIEDIKQALLEENKILVK